jgi:transposase
VVPACLPIPRSLHVEALLLAEDGLTILVGAEAPNAPCPLCGWRSGRVHSRYARTPADLPWATLAVRLRVDVREFFYANDACPRQIFAERLTGIAQAHARRTDRQCAALTAIAFALGGEAGARLARHLGSPVSPDTLLRLIRRAPEAEVPTPTVLGVDDWAIHKGLTYGTILVDLERHRPIDLLPDRSSESLAAWLQAHPGIEVVARDRAGAYAEGARGGAPNATQVADRWHLADNQADALEAFFRGKGAYLKAAAAALAGRTEEPGRTRAPPDEVYQGKRRHPKPPLCRERAEAAAEERLARRRANYDQVHAMQAAGVGVGEIARRVGVARMTVDNYLGEGPPQRRRHTVHGQRRVIEPWEPYLLQRWNEGCRMATRLWREIRGMGFAYSLTNVHRFVNQLRHEGAPPVGQRPTSPLTKVQGPTPRAAHGGAARLPHALAGPGPGHRRRDRSRRGLPADAAPAGGRAVAGLARRRGGERHQRVGALRRQTPRGPRRRAGRVDAAPQQRADGGSGHQAQARQAPGLRPGQGRPPPEAGAPGSPTSGAPEAPRPTLPPDHRMCGRPTDC